MKILIEFAMAAICARFVNSTWQCVKFYLFCSLPVFCHSSTQHLTMFIVLSKSIIVHITHTHTDTRYNDDSRQTSYPILFPSLIRHTTMFTFTLQWYYIWCANRIDFRIDCSNSIIIHRTQTRRILFNFNFARISLIQTMNIWFSSGCWIGELRAKFDL